MKNMGPRSSAWLASVGIHTLDKVTLNMLWGLRAALLDLPWSELSPDIKEELRKQVEEV